jgi:hypothetical protein
MSITALTLFAMLLTTQQPSAGINGTWTMIADRSGSPTQTPPVNEMTLTVIETGTGIRVQWLRGTEQPEAIEYPLIDEPKQPADPLGPDQARAYWEGNRLILERGGRINGQTISMKQSLTLDPSANELTLERLVIVQHGYTLKGTRNYATVKDVFARARQ